LGLYLHLFYVQRIYSTYCKPGPGRMFCPRMENTCMYKHTHMQITPALFMLLHWCIWVGRQGLPFLLAIDIIGFQRKRSDIF
jgi:hypothetical protein